MGKKQFKFRQLSARLAVTRLLRQPFQIMTQLAAFAFIYVINAFNPYSR